MSKTIFTAESSVANTIIGRLTFSVDGEHLTDADLVHVIRKWPAADCVVVAPWGMNGEVYDGAHLGFIRGLGGMVTGHTVTEL